jgi:hypothetical protein
VFGFLSRIVLPSGCCFLIIACHGEFAATTIHLTAQKGQRTIGPVAVTAFSVRPAFSTLVVGFVVLIVLRSMLMMFAAHLRRR